MYARNFQSKRSLDYAEKPFEEISDRSGKKPTIEKAPPNNVLILTVENCQYDINVDVIYSICSTIARVVRIVIFLKAHVHAMVEFESIEDATNVINGIDGAEIYSGCCLVKCGYSRAKKLNVFRNTNLTWDYSAEESSQTLKRGPLLPAPVSDRKSGGPFQSSEFSSPVARYGHGESYGENYANGGTPGGRFGHMEGGSRFAYSDTGRGGFRGTPRYAPKDAHVGNGMYEYPRMTSPSFRPMNSVRSDHGCILMVYGLNVDEMTPKRLFNILCLYGNVGKIKFLVTKPGTAMVQMGDSGGLNRVLQYLQNANIMGSVIQFSVSKQQCLNEVHEPKVLANGSLSYVDFSDSRDNRYLDERGAARNRPMDPKPYLHFYNAPVSVTEDDIRNVFDVKGVVMPEAVAIFPPNPSARSSTGLVQFRTADDATAALAICNHTLVKCSDENRSANHRPFAIKLCYSATNALREGRRSRGGSVEDEQSFMNDSCTTEDHYADQ